jgi:hypothetical protein
MLKANEVESSPATPAHRGWWHKRWIHVSAVATVIVATTLALAALYEVRHAEPILRENLVRALSDRFHATVELDHLYVSVLHGLQVRGQGLRVLRPQSDPKAAMPAEDSANLSPQLLKADSFTFRMPLHDLFEKRVHLSLVRLNGLEIDIPPHGLGDLPRPQQRGIHRPTVSFLVDTILCDNTKLIVQTSRPGKDPLDFEIPHLQLTDVDLLRPTLYVADVVNPKPMGDIHAFGHFGPWQPDDPRTSPIDGDYRFEHADLNTIKGIGGILSSTGHYEGELGHITIDGTTETPDFSIDESHHPMHLSTRFHAYVDGTSGDTTLDPVQARLGHSDFTASGDIVRVRGKGHDIDLMVSMPHGRIEDLLRLGMKTQPPVVNGAVCMHARLHIPPSQTRTPVQPVTSRMQLAGNLSITGVEFSNRKLQDRIDGLSMRAQGRPGEVRSASTDRKAEVASQMRVGFALSNAMMTVSSLYYEVPGAKVDLRGVYSLDGNIFEFKGHVRTEARASQMVTGWKSFLLKPVDRFLAKNGAGVELPVSISGAKGDMRFGLATNADETPQAMAEDVKARRRADREVQQNNRQNPDPGLRTPVRQPSKP